MDHLFVFMYEFFVGGKFNSDPMYNLFLTKWLLLFCLNFAGCTLAIEKIIYVSNQHLDPAVFL